MGHVFRGDVDGEYCHYGVRVGLLSQRGWGGERVSELREDFWWIQCRVFSAAVGAGDGVWDFVWDPGCDCCRGGGYGCLSEHLGEVVEAEGRAVGVLDVLGRDMDGCPR